MTAGLEAFCLFSLIFVILDFKGRYFGRFDQIYIILNQNKYASGLKFDVSLRLEKSTS
jgi:hypothetical protein